VIHALRNLPPEEAERLRKIFEMRTDDRRLIRETINLMKKAGSIEYTKQISRGSKS